MIENACYRLISMTYTNNLMKYIWGWHDFKNCLV